MSGKAMACSARRPASRWLRSLAPVANRLGFREDLLQPFRHAQLGGPAPEVVPIKAFPLHGCHVQGVLDLSFGGRDLVPLKLRKDNVFCGSDGERTSRDGLRPSPTELLDAERTIFAHDQIGLPAGCEINHVEHGM